MIEQYHTIRTNADIEQFQDISNGLHDGYINISQWQIKSFHFSDMIGFSILILENGTFLWADDISGNIDDLRQGSYVISESIQYRLLS